VRPRPEIPSEIEEFRDERWTSREAERTIRGAGVANDRRKPTIDMLSAVILLQSYLDSVRLASMRLENLS